MSRVLTLAVFACVMMSSFAKPPELPEDVDKAMGGCEASTGVDPKLLENAFAKGQFVDDPKFKCFLKCVFITMGDMSESGELLIDNMKSRSPPGLTKEQSSKIIDDCTKSTGADPCEVAYNVAKCMMEEAVKLMQQLEHH